MGNEDIHPKATGTPDSADQPTSETESVQPSEDTTDSGTDALEAMDQVEQNTQSLIEDAIDTLMDSDDGQAENQGDASDSMSSDDIDAMLDTLDANVTEQNVNDADQPAGEPAAFAGLEDIENMSDDELLSGIAEELLNDESNPLGEHLDHPVELNTPAETDSIPEEAQTDIESAIEDAFEDSVDIPSEITEAIDSSAEDETENETHDAADDTSAESLADELSEETKGTLDHLDDILAGEGDDLISGNFETPEGDLIDSEDAGIQDASALLDQLNLDDLGLDAETEPASQTEEESQPQTDSTPEDSSESDSQPDVQDQPESVAETDSAAPAPTPQADAPKSPANAPMPSQMDDLIADEKSLPDIESIWQITQRHAKRIGLLAFEQAKLHATPIAARGVLLINKPVQDKAPQLRDTIGFLALWTALLATILWFYIAFVRETPTPTPTTAPTRMLQQGEIVDPLRNPPPRN